MEIPLVYEFESEDELLAGVEPDGKDTLRRELLWLCDEASEEELPRIFTSVVLLWHAGHRPLKECLHTAIVWERG